jgi:hypothetical protein
VFSSPQQCENNRYEECFQPSCRNVSRPIFSKNCREVYDEECEVIIEQTLQQQCKEVDQTGYEEQCNTVTEEKCSTVTEYKCKQPQLASPVDPLTYNPYEVNRIFSHGFLTQRLWTS